MNLVVAGLENRKLDFESFIGNTGLEPVLSRPKT